jgi:hypothetical protein
MAGDAEWDYKRQRYSQRELPMSPEEEPPPPMGDYWDKDGRLSRAREGGLPMLTDRGCRLREPEPCMVCGPWPPQKRAWLRESLEVIPLRGTVCEECMESWWANLPKGPRLER